MHEWVWEMGLCVNGACACVREASGWWAWGNSFEVLTQLIPPPPLLTHPSPCSYVENQQRLQRLEFGDLQGLGELRSL